MDFLMRIEATGLSTWLRESPSVWAFPTVLTLHTLGLGLILGGSSIISLRILGSAPRMPLKPLEKLFPIIWTGFAINAASGLLLLVKAATTAGISVLFWTKIGIIVLAMIVVVRMRAAVFGDPEVDNRAISGKAKALAVASIALWTAAIVAGRLLAYVGPTQAESSVTFG
jgi:hypothetical protein